MLLDRHYGLIVISLFLFLVFDINNSIAQLQHDSLSDTSQIKNKFLQFSAESLKIGKRELIRAQRDFIRSLGQSSILRKQTFPPERFNFLAINFRLCFMHTLDKVYIPTISKDQNHNPKIAVQDMQGANTLGFSVDLNFVELNKIIFGMDFDWSQIQYRSLDKYESLKYKVDNYSVHTYFKYAYRHKRRFKPFLKIGIGYLLSQRADISFKNHLVDPEILTASGCMQLFVSQALEFKPDRKSPFVYISEFQFKYNLTDTDFIDQYYIYVGLGIGFLL